MGQLGLSIHPAFGAARPASRTPHRSFDRRPLSVGAKGLRKRARLPLFELALGGTIGLGAAFALWWFGS
jgi:hypothetical protein